MERSEITTFETSTRRGTEIMNNLNQHAGKLCTRHQFALSSWEGRCSSGRSNYATATNQYAAPARKKNEPLLAAGTNFCPVHWPLGAGEQANGGSVTIASSFSLAVQLEDFALKQISSLLFFVCATFALSSPVFHLATNNSQQPRLHFPKLNDRVTEDRLM